jgi:hypothetical protein
MTSPDTSQDEPGNPGFWLEHPAATLAAAKLPGQVTDTAGEPSLTITLAHPGCRDTEVIADADGYCELRWRLTPDAAPDQAAAAITAALDAAHVPAVAS